MYYVMIALLMFVAPVVSIVGELAVVQNPAELVILVGKWFIFWGVGVRLFTAGLKQVSQPSFTASIMKIKSKDSYIVIRELGFANLAIGTVALSIAFNTEWIVPAAIAGAIFYGAAGLQHVTKKPATTMEAVALASDLFMALVCVGFLIGSFLL
jgi:hypothetical protein